MAGGFDEVYTRYGARIHGYLCRLTSDPATADELCQEVFLRYLREERRLVGRNGSLRAWLFRVATNAAIDRSRRRSTARLSGDRPAAAGTDPAERSDTAGTIARAVADLPPALRAAFLLRAHHELAWRDVGDALGVSERAAKDRFRRAREQLVRRLGKALEEDA